MIQEDIAGVLHSKNNFYFRTNEAYIVHMVLKFSLKWTVQNMENLKSCYFINLFSAS